MDRNDTDSTDDQLAKIGTDRSAQDPEPERGYASKDEIDAVFKELRAIFLQVFDLRGQTIWIRHHYSRDSVDFEEEVWCEEDDDFYVNDVSAGEGLSDDERFQRQCEIDCDYAQRLLGKFSTWNQSVEQLMNRFQRERIPVLEKNIVFAFAELPTFALWESQFHTLFDAFRKLQHMLFIWMNSSIEDLNRFLEEGFENEDFCDVFDSIVKGYPVKSEQQGTLLERFRLEHSQLLRDLPSIHAITSPWGDAGRDKDEVPRQDLISEYGITSQSLNYRIEEMGHPRPCRVEGRKQWFSRAAIEVWKKSQNG